MNLKEAICKIENTPSWGIYAEHPFTEESEACIVQNCFENGGLLDDKRWFCNGDTANDAVETQLDYSLGDIEYQREVAVESLIQEISATGEFDWGPDA